MEEEKRYEESGAPTDDVFHDEICSDSNVPSDGEIKEGTEPVEPTPHPASEKREGPEPIPESKPISESESVPEPPGQVLTEETEGEHSSLNEISLKLDGIADTERRIFSEVREMHRLYHGEFAGRLKSMQDELEQYRKIEKGRVYDDILAAIARIYGNNETLADEVEEPKAQKHIRYMLLDLEDLMSDYGMSKLRSAPGEKRNPRYCQILNRVPTDDPAQHDTVAKSYNAGFYIGNKSVIKELVDIYFYEAPATKPDTEKRSTEEPDVDSDADADADSNADSE